MIRNYFLELIGFGYIINHGTREIHKLENVVPRCNIYIMKNYGYGTKLYTKILIKYFGYDGCSYCYKEKNKW